MSTINLANVSLFAESRLTERSQTTIPAAIRDALHLKPGEFITYSLLPGGNVLLSRKDNEQDDPVIGPFLAFLENDMRTNPQHIQPVMQAMWAGLEELTAGVDVDLDAPLKDD